uniref:Phospholipid-transporting ATPase n=1 Tax=Trypanosoma congolense (strain IL3000) TaxID=1068625 RepID=G0UZV5_TRYCI|nr:putative phospholipid-transporting ATPase 1-like protein [Trypanosoma congolense IL3000]
MKRCFTCSSCYGRVKEEEEEEAEVPSGETMVYMNDLEANEAFNYPDNFIRTSHYTLLSFLPLGLWMQLKRASNFYFFTCMCLTLIPGVSPVAPITAILPLVFVVAVSMVKEGLEEYRRYSADKIANSVEVEVLVNGKIELMPSRDIRVGNVVRVSNGEEVRADLLCLSTSDEEGYVYIDMCNLDGETSLKCREAVEQTASLRTPEEIQGKTMKIITTGPDPELHSWAGCIEYEDEGYAVDIRHFVCRGSVLRKTDWIWGVVVYAGSDTKMFRNLKDHPIKVSDLDSKLNRMIYSTMIFQMITLIILSTLAVLWNIKHKNHWYITVYTTEYSAVTIWLRSFVTFYLLLSYFIPISLFVTIEVCKAVQMYWMAHDNKMMANVGGRQRRCRPNTSNLNEQLAMVRFIFTDKTGTLTENIMTFKQGDFHGYRINVDDENSDPTEYLDHTSPAREAAYEYFLALSVCNTVQPSEDPDDPQKTLYDGASPDEVALVTMASQYGFRLLKRTAQEMRLVVEGVERIYKILATLEFSPERKMMSIIVQDTRTKHIVLFTKGADSSLLPRLSMNQQSQNYVGTLRGSLADMSACGLRTLVLGRRFLLPEEFEKWHVLYKQAGKKLADRSAALDNVCLQIEDDLWPVGATAIEDKLQDAVPETVAFFLEANVIIWMLTGDKRETAVTIGATARLCDPRQDSIMHIDIGSLDPNDPKASSKAENDLLAVERELNRVAMAGTKCVIVIDGPALTTSMENHFDLFLGVSSRVNSAICCRLTPLQKANVVRMFQVSTGLTALAIGDGANDVSMIQEGRVGIGIIGLEGSQAALSADYAIPRFKHLLHLLAVHGRYSVLRNSNCILVSFYKNAVIGVMMMLFCFYSGYSGGTIFDGWLLTFYNIILTSAPPFLIGIFDEDLPEEVLLTRPDLFAQLSRGLYFNMSTVLRWFVEAMFHGVAFFYCFHSTLGALDWTQQNNISFLELGTMELVFVVTVVLIRCGLLIRYWRPIHVLGIFFSFLVTMLCVAVYSSFLSLWDTTIYYHAFTLWSGMKFWVYLLLFSGFVIAINLSLTYIQKRAYPTLRDLAHEEWLMGVVPPVVEELHSFSIQKERSSTLEKVADV